MWGRGGEFFFLRRWTRAAGEDEGDETDTDREFFFPCILTGKVLSVSFSGILKKNVSISVKKTDTDIFPVY